MHVQIYLKSSSVQAIALHVESALGRPLRAKAEISSPDPLDGESLPGTPVRLEITSDEGSTAIHHGIIASSTAIATANPDAQRLYTLEVRSAIEFLAYRKNARIFRKKNAVTIVKEVLAGVGIEGDLLTIEIAEPPLEREHVTQWNEADATFLRRICEEEGLYFRFDPKDGFDAFVLCDRSSDAPESLTDPLSFVDSFGLRANERFTYNPSRNRARRVGKVAVRDDELAGLAQKCSADCTTRRSGGEVTLTRVSLP